MRLSQSLSFDRQRSESRCLYSKVRSHFSTEDCRINKKPQDTASGASQEKGKSLLGFRHSGFFLGTESPDSIIKVAWRFFCIAEGCIIKAKRKTWAGGDLQTWKFIKVPCSSHGWQIQLITKKCLLLRWSPRCPWTLALACRCWDYHVHHAQPLSAFLWLFG